MICVRRLIVIMQAIASAAKQFWSLAWIASPVLIMTCLKPGYTRLTKPFSAIMVLILSNPVFAWNHLGHKLVAQIAWDHMTPEMRVKTETWNRAMEAVYAPLSFIEAATWLDTIRYQDIKWYNTWHYMDWFFSDDGTPLPPVSTHNHALTAVKHALLTLRGKYARNFDRGFAMRVLVHVVADIHQPMHATTRVSAEYPKGDAGGNYYRIQSRIARNLHAYWDRGGGALNSRDQSEAWIQKKAQQLAASWPCDSAQAVDLNPQHWLAESHTIGQQKAYTLKQNTAPDKEYEEETRLLSEQRIALAGCRLAALLNTSHKKINNRTQHDHHNKNTRRN